ncbi:MAG: hypothetical protein ACOYKA_03740 [Legionellaceae bacterium]
MKNKFSFISAAIAATLSTHTFAIGSSPASMSYVQTQVANVQTQLMNYVNSIVNAIPATPTYKVGDIALGGTVFYVDNTGTHGLVASPLYAGGDSSSAKSWVGVQPDTQDIFYFLVGAFGNGIGAGAMNTALSSGGQSAYFAQNNQDYSDMAALYCVGLSAKADGQTPCSNPGAPGEPCYADYYLPSNYELYQMYLKRDILHMWVDVDTTPAFVWSSTEIDAQNAYRINVSESDQELASVEKNAGCGVWCIRQF